MCPGPLCRLSLLVFERRGVRGAAVQDGSFAFDDADGAAPARIRLGSGAEEVRLSGFPTWFDDDRIVRAVVGVRYRTTGMVTYDFYRIEASIPGTFRPPPGHAYTPIDWNYFTPIVGRGGPNAPAENPDYAAARVLVRPNVPAYREVSATLTKNPTLAPGSAEYVWPAVTRSDLATTTVRVAAAPVAGTAGNELWQIELDAAWIDIYGWQVPRPGEVTGLLATRLTDGALEVSFEPLASASRYNLYFGRLDTLRAGGLRPPGIDPKVELNDGHAQ